MSVGIDVPLLFNDLTTFQYFFAVSSVKLFHVVILALTEQTEGVISSMLILCIVNG